MEINYFLKEPAKDQTSVFTIIRYKGKRFKLTTGVTVETKFWDKSTHRCRVTRDYPDHDVNNMLLESLEVKLKQYFVNCKKTGDEPELESLKNWIKKKPEQPATEINFSDFLTTHIERSRLSAGTIKNYQKTLRFITQYQDETGYKLKFEDIDIRFYTNFRNWFFKLEKPGSTPKEKQYYSLNYFGLQIKQIKTIMREAGREGEKIHDAEDYKNRRFVKEQETADTVYLSIDEIDAIRALELSPETLAAKFQELTPKLLSLKVEALKCTRDHFLIGCYTALRISDFSRLERSHVSDRYIRIKPRKGQKKNEDVVIPIHPAIRPILDSGLPRHMSDQRFNEHLKQLCQLAGITEPVTVVRTEGGRQVSRTVEKWRLVSSHTARRSGATNMYLAGVPSISIMKITGHRTEKSFLRYIRISQEENAAKLAEHPFFKP